MGIGKPLILSQCLRCRLLKWWQNPYMNIASWILRSGENSCARSGPAPHSKPRVTETVANFAKSTVAGRRNGCRAVTFLPAPVPKRVCGTFSGNKWEHMARLRMASAQRSKRVLISIILLVLTYTSLYTYIYIYIYTEIHISYINRSHIHNYISLYIYMYIYIYIHIHMYICIYIYICRCLQPSVENSLALLYPPSVWNAPGYDWRRFGMT